MALAVAALLSATFAAPAAAVDAADFLVWRFSSPGPRGVGAIHDGASNTIMFAETVGLRPNTRYRLVGSTAFCGDVHQPIHQVWKTGFGSNSKGAAFTNTTFDDQAALQSIRSVRLFQGSSQVDCGKALLYSSGGGGSGQTDAFTMFTAFGARAMVFVELGSGNDALTAVGHGFISSHGYRLLGSTVACPSQPSAGTTLFERTGNTNSRGILWRNDTASNVSAPPTSIQLFNGSNRVACSNTTLLIPAVQ